MIALILTLNSTSARFVMIAIWFLSDRSGKLRADRKLFLVI